MMLAFSQFGFQVRALLYDGASSNLSSFKVLCGYTNCEIIDITKPRFKSPFDGKDVHLIVCPSHQVNICNAYLRVSNLFVSHTKGLRLIYHVRGNFPMEKISPPALIAILARIY